MPRRSRTSLSPMSESAVVLPDLHTVFGFGVAGNFAGHLEQAGEAADFASVKAASAEAPKGIFPWYVPAGVATADAASVPAFLHTFPLSHEEVALPQGEGLDLQIEPEVGLLARVEYGAGGDVDRLVPEAIGAFNDCSIRRPGAEKISHKKNWGAGSKGLAPLLLGIHDLAPDGPTATFRLACFLRRDGVAHPYGVDSAVPDYSYYGQQLLDWLVDRLQHQTGAAGTPLEPVGAYLRAAGNPDHVLIGIGATRYTPLGESTFLGVDDESIVVVYDASVTEPAAVELAVADGVEDELPAASVLRQRVVAGGATPVI